MTVHRPKGVSICGVIMLVVVMQGCSADVRVAGPNEPAEAGTALTLATRVIDQNNPVDPGALVTFGLGGVYQARLAQTFTAGVTGRLAVVAVPIACAVGSSVTLEVRDAALDGSPGSRLFATTTYPGHEFPSIMSGAMVAMRVRPTVEVREGQRYAFTLRATGDCGMAPAAAGDTYPGGVAFGDALPNPPGWIPLFGWPNIHDLAFTTRVDIP